MRRIGASVGATVPRWARSGSPAQPVVGGLPSPRCRAVAGLVLNVTIRTVELRAGHSARRRQADRRRLRSAPELAMPIRLPRPISLRMPIRLPRPIRPRMPIRLPRPIGLRMPSGFRSPRSDARRVRDAAGPRGPRAGRRSTSSAARWIGGCAVRRAPADRHARARPLLRNGAVGSSSGPHHGAAAGRRRAGRDLRRTPVAAASRARRDTECRF